MATFPEERLERLTTQLLGGEVVFFIGSGMSQASEGNTTSRLLGRLFARCVAVAMSLAPFDRDAAALLTALQKTFQLEGDPREPARLMTKTNLAKLTNQYYVFNDWICKAYAQLGAPLYAMAVDQKKVSLDGISRLENVLLRRLTGDKVPLDRIDEALLESLQNLTSFASQGKALFLETLGFSNRDMWAGDSVDTLLETLSESYGARLLPRHDVLAALAREGLTPILITTNYDLLLEGGYLKSGFQSPSRAPAAGAQRERELFEASTRSFSVIASPEQFFDAGKGYRSALIIKIHGCLHRYRVAVGPSKDFCAVEPYLPSIVYTYREIQNWRDDAWSRDLLRTLLRTRTMVFCGYSTMDTVIHDTFRTVYEEMRDRRRDNGAADERPPAQRKARAYFFDTEGKKDFYGLEVLRAASEAAGEPPQPLASHENLVSFHTDGCFPDLDELYRWLMHRTARGLQRHALREKLVAVVQGLLGRQSKDRFEFVEKIFAELCEAERKAARDWRTGDGSRAAFNRVVSWTEQFHAALRRTFALREFVLRRESAGLEIDEYGGLPWYCPISDHFDWTAWSVVVELAVRRMIAYWTSTLAPGRTGPGLVATPRVHAGDGPHAEVVFSAEEDPAPRRILIRFQLAGGQGEVERAGQTGSLVEWSLGHRIPWNISDDRRPGAGHGGWERYAGNDRTPAAETLWKWAASEQPGPWNHELEYQLGLSHHVEQANLP